MDPITIGRVQLYYQLKSILDPPSDLHDSKQILKKESKEKLNYSDFSEISEDDEEDEEGEEEEEENEHDWKKRRGQYEVERIIDRCDFGNGEIYYLVKWKYWQNKYNTWEPAEHLCCMKRIAKYLERIVYRCREDMISKMIFSLVEPTEENIVDFMKSLLSEKEEVTLKVLTERRLRTMACTVHKMAKKKRQSKEKDYEGLLRKAFLVKYLFVRRSCQLTALKEWQDEMNRLSSDPAEVEVENEYDIHVPPDNFFYVNQYIPGPNVVIPDDPPVGCKCRVCDAKSLCCSSLAKSKFAYTPSGRLRVSSDVPIYECNKKCRCNSDCVNRVVQKGRNIKLCIFRTPDNRGWGVKTLEDIKKGTYVCTYLGEVIDTKETEKRIKKYKGNANTYLFDMDFYGANYSYTVDATDYGTIARFINHSCNPNLCICFVWIDCLDPSLPLLAFFTGEFIEAGTELSIDYVGDPSKMDPTVRRKTKPCRCGSKNCKKIVF